MGGAVRDLLRGQKVMDWDLATDALPEEVIALFHRKNIAGNDKNRPQPRSFVVPTGIRHGTVTVHFKGLSLEVTTFRSESGYSDRRRPDKVEFGHSIDEDLSRRDFTMNAAAYALPSGPFVDPFEGLKDIKKHVIRAVGKADERFSEDGLRPIRALRFVSQLGFTLDEELLKAIPGAIPFTAEVASERIRDELEKIIASERPSAALLLMEKTGILRLLIPELAACRVVGKDFLSGMGRHRFDLLEHSLLACDFAARTGQSPGVRLAALYHDIGKLTSGQKDESGNISFHRHEKQSAVMARQILVRFRYPKAEIDRTCHLIEEHMFNYSENWTDVAVRRFIIRVGPENLDDLFALRRADAYAMAGEEAPRDFLFPLTSHIEKVLTAGGALRLKDLTVSGKDLMAQGIPSGKTMGIILHELLEAVLNDQSLNTREKLLEIAGKLNARYAKS